jgi:hypothetical protein
VSRSGFASVLVVVSLAACSSDHDAGQFGRRSSPTTATAPDVATATTVASTATTVTTVTTVTTLTTPPSTTARSAGGTSTSAGGPNVVVGTAVAGSAGAVERGRGPYKKTDPFSEAVRLVDGTCVGWESRGGSTSGLAVGAPVAVLDPTTSALLGTGTITASRWEDPSRGGGQWTCFFAFRAEVSRTPPADVLVKVADLQPWTARPDPAHPAARVASVSTDAAIRLIASCPALPSPTTTAAPTASTVTTTTAVPTTTVARRPVAGWKAIGRYWSIGVDALCRAGLAVTAIARPCRQPNVGSDYITAVVNADHPAVEYADGAAIPAGTPLAVRVATGRPCA